jgi:hypothetical protein
MAVAGWGSPRGLPCRNGAPAPCGHAVATTPAGSIEPIRSYFSIVVGLPLIHDRSCIAGFGACSAFTCYGLHARQVAIATLSIEGFRGFVTSAAASTATGWSKPVPGRDLHPLKTNAFSRRTYIVGQPEVL